MKLTKQLYKKVTNLVTNAKEDFRARGWVIPFEEEDGRIRFDNYSVVKQDGFYSVLSPSDSVLVEFINLPQTAILIANDLALGRLSKDVIIAHDKVYGYCLFEGQQLMQVANASAKKKDWNRYDILMEKYARMQLKVEYAKKNIMYSFEKLRQIR